MEQALHDERTTLFVQHNDARQKIKQLRAEMLVAHLRITEIDKIEQAEKSSPDRSLDQGIKPVHVEVKLG